MAAKTIELMSGKLDSPIGEILVACEGKTLCAVEFADFEVRMIGELRTRYGDIRIVETSDPGGVCARIQAYLRGTLDAIDDIAVDGGGTEFQRKVWAELRKIVPGKLLTYAALAERLGIPKAVRAVGHANAQNPINIVVPCHRVIGASGALTGYSGGLARKRWLLEHEGAVLKPLGNDGAVRR
jgi:methylated-DNA-[protein]-cysteine S-methyltransferase